MLNLSRCIRHRGPDWSGCVVATHGTAKVQRLSEAQSKAREEVSKQGPQEYDTEDDEDESERGSILCHERLAIVGIGKCQC